MNEAASIPFLECDLVEIEGRTNGAVAIYKISVPPQHKADLRARAALAWAVGWLEEATSEPSITSIEKGSKLLPKDTLVKQPSLSTPYFFTVEIPCKNRQEGWDKISEMRNLICEIARIQSTKPNQTIAK